MQKRNWLDGMLPRGGYREDTGFQNPWVPDHMERDHIVKNQEKYLSDRNATLDISRKQTEHDVEKQLAPYRVMQGQHQALGTRSDTKVKIATENDRIQQQGHLTRQQGALADKAEVEARVAATIEPYTIEKERLDAYVARETAPMVISKAEAEAALADEQLFKQKIENEGLLMNLEQQKAQAIAIDESHKLMSTARNWLETPDLGTQDQDLSSMIPKIVDDFIDQSEARHVHIQQRDQLINALAQEAMNRLKQQRGKVPTGDPAAMLKALGIGSVDQAKNSVADRVHAVQQQKDNLEANIRGLQGLMTYMGEYHTKVVNNDAGIHVVTHDDAGNLSNYEFVPGIVNGVNAPARYHAWTGHPLSPSDYLASANNVSQSGGKFSARPGDMGPPESPYASVPPEQWKDLTPEQLLIALQGPVNQRGVDVKEMSVGSHIERELSKMTTDTQNRHALGFLRRSLMAAGADMKDADVKQAMAEAASLTPDRIYSGIVDMLLDQNGDIAQRIGGSISEFLTGELSQEGKVYRANLGLESLVALRQDYRTRYLNAVESYIEEQAMHGVHLLEHEKNALYNKALARADRQMPETGAILNRAVLSTALTKIAQNKPTEKMWKTGILDLGEGAIGRNSYEVIDKVIQFEGSSLEDVLARAPGISDITKDGIRMNFRHWKAQRLMEDITVGKSFDGRLVPAIDGLPHNGFETQEDSDKIIPGTEFRIAFKDDVGETNEIKYHLVNDGQQLMVWSPQIPLLENGTLLNSEETRAFLNGAGELKKNPELIHNLSWLARTFPGAMLSKWFAGQNIAARASSDQAARQQVTQQPYQPEPSAAAEATPHQPAVRQAPAGTAGPAPTAAAEGTSAPGGVTEDAYGHPAPMPGTSVEPSGVDQGFRRAAPPGYQRDMRFEYGDATNPANPRLGQPVFTRPEGGRQYPYPPTREYPLGGQTIPFDPTKDFATREGVVVNDAQGNRVTLADPQFDPRHGELPTGLETIHRRGMHDKGERRRQWAQEDLANLPRVWQHNPPNPASPYARPADRITLQDPQPYQPETGLEYLARKRRAGRGDYRKRTADMHLAEQEFQDLLRPPQYRHDVSDVMNEVSTRATTTIEHDVPSAGQTHNRDPLSLNAYQPQYDMASNPGTAGVSPPVPNTENHIRHSLLSYDDEGAGNRTMQVDPSGDPNQEMQGVSGDMVGDVEELTPGTPEFKAYQDLIKRVWFMSLYLRMLQQTKMPRHLQPR